MLQITKKRRNFTEGDEREVKSTDSILDIIQLNMISKMAAESNQEARRLEDRAKEEKKLEREKAKEEAKEERLRIDEQNRHEQLVMQGQQFQMMMMMIMQGKSPAMHPMFPAPPLPNMQGLIQNTISMSSVTESPRSIPKDSNEIMDLETKR